MRIMNREKLCQLLNLAKQEVPFYKKLLTNININKENYEKIFKNLPILKKNDINKNIFSFVSEYVDSEKLKKVLDEYKIDFACESCKEIDGKKYYIECTSGTTGSPFISIKTEIDRMRLSNCLWKARFVHNNRKPSKMFLFVHTADGKYPFPCEENFTLEHNLREMQYLCDKDYEWWHIFPGYLINYSICVQAHHIKFPNLKGIECNGAYLSGEEKKNYESIFNCKIVNNYGCKEIWNIAFDDADGNLVLNPDVIFELVDEEGNIIDEPEKVGFAVVTSLNLTTMPFIRYFLGDKAYYKADENGSCSNQIDFVASRCFISQTTINGNSFFKEVVVSMAQNNNLRMLRFVNIKEVEHGMFKVLFGCDSKYREIVEKNFIQDVNFFADYYAVDSSNWKYELTYTDRLDSPEKSIFVSLV